MKPNFNSEGIVSIKRNFTFMLEYSFLPLPLEYLFFLSDKFTNTVHITCQQKNYWQYLTISQAKSELSQSCWVVFEGVFVWIFPVGKSFFWSSQPHMNATSDVVGFWEFHTPVLVELFAVDKSFLPTQGVQRMLMFLSLFTE